MKNYLAIVLLLLCTNAFSATSKWVDENGSVHYSDLPPLSNVEATILRPDNYDSTGDVKLSEGSAANKPKTIYERVAELKKQQEEQEAADKAQQVQAGIDAKQVSCNGAKGNLRMS
jgi:hypothetical protein